MLTRERSSAPPFLKLSAIGLTSRRCIHHRFERINAFCFVPISLRFVLYRLYRRGPFHPLRSLARLAQDEEPGCTGGEARGGRGVVTVSDLLLQRVSPSRAGAEDDDYDVIGPDGFVIGRIFKATSVALGTRWMWTLAYGQHEDRTPTHGYEPTREAAMQAFAKSWHRET
jgi:hypothetical protein